MALRGLQNYGSLARVALKEWIEMQIYLHRDASDMCRDLMGGPSVTRTDATRVCVSDGFKKRLSFATSGDHIESVFDRNISVNLSDTAPGTSERRVRYSVARLSAVKARNWHRPTSVVLVGGEPP